MLTDHRGLHPLHFAALSDNKEMFEFILENEDCVSKNKFDLNVTTVDGFTPIHYCCHKGSLDTL
jgi:ankyrin repeat protein